MDLKDFQKKDDLGQAQVIQAFKNRIKGHVTKIKGAKAKSEDCVRYLDFYTERGIGVNPRCSGK